MTRRRALALPRRLAAGLLVLALAVAAGRLAPPPEAAADWLTARLEAGQAELGLVVESIAVTGRENTPRGDLERVLAPARGSVLSKLDIAALQKRLSELAWVRAATVARRLPDTLEVTLSERAPFALWQRDGELALVDRAGVVLTREDLARWRSLPLIVGPGAPAAAPALLERLAGYPELADRVEAAMRVGERRWDLKLQSGLRLKLPGAGLERAYGPERALARLKRLQRRHRLLARAVSVVDLRLADRLVVRLSPHGRAIGLARGEDTTT